mmetsp:Transcript_24210/g.39775  ORF Transcript_24210/g.39775 Transcript_24210/m.39775 type:complete len:183 (-) Transcript_24210:134-682(-)
MFDTRRAVLAGIQLRKVAKLGGLVSQQVNELSTLLSSARLSLAFATNVMTSGCVADLLTHKAMIKSRLEEIVSQQVRLEPCEEADMKVFLDVDRASDVVKGFISLEEIKPSKAVLRLSEDLRMSRHKVEQLKKESLRMNDELKKTREEVERGKEENTKLNGELQKYRDEAAQLKKVCMPSRE